MNGCLRALAGLILALMIPRQAVLRSEQEPGVLLATPSAAATTGARKNVRLPPASAPWVARLSAALWTNGTGSP